MYADVTYADVMYAGVMYADVIDAVIFAAVSYASCYSAPGFLLVLFVRLCASCSFCFLFLRSS
jgi:hypothetical protein